MMQGRIHAGQDVFLRIDPNSKRKLQVLARTDAAAPRPTASDEPSSGTEPAPITAPTPEPTTDISAEDDLDI